MKLIIFCFLIISIGLAQETEKPSADEPSVDGGEESLDREETPSEKAFQNYHNGEKLLREKFRADFASVIEHAESAEVFLLSFSMEKELPEAGILLGFNNDEEVSDSHYMKERSAEDFKKRPTHFFVEPYKLFSKILSRKKLEGKSLKECKEATAELLRSAKGLTGAWCHYPIHGLRFLDSEGFIVFQTSICYHCENYYLRYPDGGMNRDGFEKTWVGFDGEKLEAFLKREMPIPKSEIERFEAKFKKKSGNGE